jgi:hypothetical protein
MIANPTDIPIQVDVQALQSKVDLIGSRDFSSAIAQLLQPQPNIGNPAPTCFAAEISVGATPIWKALPPGFMIQMQTEWMFEGTAAAWVAQGHQVVWQKRTDIPQSGFFNDLNLKERGLYVFLLYCQKKFNSGQRSWRVTLQARDPRQMMTPIGLVSYSRQMTSPREIAMWFFDNTQLP